MACFHPPNDDTYLAWLAAHPDGYVINTEPSGRGDMRLHRAGCRTIQYRPPFVGTSYIKICCTRVDEADQWAMQRRGTPASRCGSPGCWQ